MTSLTLTLSGKSSQLQANYFPAIDLSDGDYVCGLIDFQTFNSIPNIDESNNLFYYGHENLSSNEIAHESSSSSEIIKNNDGIVGVSSISNDNDDSSIIDAIVIDQKPEENSVKIVRPPRKKNAKLPLACIKIPTGSYEVDDLGKYLSKTLSDKGVLIGLRTNNNTLKSELWCSQPVDFTKPNSVGAVLGFKNKKPLRANKAHISQLPADIMKINVIRVDCNIISGSYLNNRASHTIHQFSPTVPPGYKIVEVPQNVIYFPVTVQNIDTLNLSIIDQDDRIVDFRGETITIRLHIKKIK